MNITPLDIKQKQFRLKFRGFDMSEVDSFLEDVTAEMETMMRENDQLRTENQALQASLSEFKETEKNLRDTLDGGAEDVRGDAPRHGEGGGSQA